MALRRKAIAPQSAYDVLSERIERLEKQVKSLRQAGASTFQRVDTSKHADPVAGETVVHSKGQYDPLGLDTGPIDLGTRPKYRDHDGNWRLFSNVPKCLVDFEDGSITGGSINPAIGGFYTDAPDLFGYGDEGGVQINAANQFILVYATINLGQPVRQGVHRLSLGWLDAASPVMTGGNAWFRLASDTSPGDQENALTLLNFGRGNSGASLEVRITYELSSGLGSTQNFNSAALVVLWLGDYNPFTNTPFTWGGSPPAPIVPPNPT